MPSVRLVAAAAAVAVATGANCATWYESTAHGPGFRNVKGYGAKGDGVTDDSAALIAALTQGRPQGFTTTDPTVVYLPPGTYLVSQTLPLIFYTFMVGNFLCPPTILVANNSNFHGYIIDGDTGDENSEHTDEFYRGISYINIQIGNGNPGATGIHWAESQATYIRNVTIDIQDSGAVGIFGENGSGGFISDIVINGGKIGLNFGNQQWTFRNVVVSGSAEACINLFWNWLFALVGVTLSNCPVGIAFHGHAAGSLMILDSSFTNVGTAVSTDYPTQPVALLLERLTATNVANITNGYPGSPNGVVTVTSWRQGTAFTAGAPATPGQAPLPLMRADVPLPQMAKPTFGSPDGSTGVYNVYDAGAKGDGYTDDTAAIQAAIDANDQVFFPQGQYLVSGTITLRSNSVLVGEALSTLLASASSPQWSTASIPAPLLFVPSNASGVAIVDMLFASTGPVPGCVYLSWTGGAALWDTHWRVMHTANTLLSVTGAAANGYLENFWAWVADHDIDTGANVTVLNPAGVSVVDTSLPIIMLGVAAEHSFNWQFNFTRVTNLTVVLLQTESPYWQNPQSAWAVAADAAAMSLYGAGSYSWFYPNQSALISVTASPAAQLYDINTYGCDTVLVGQDSVFSNASGVSNWFCHYFIADIRP